MINIFETRLQSDQIWYFGNNRRKDLRLSQPKWNYPFFLTTSYEYARDYADYGVYKIILSNQEDLNTLDFNNQQEVQQLHWPKIVAFSWQSSL